MESTARRVILNIHISHIRAIYTRKNKTRLILDEMCRLYGKFASYLRRVLCKTRLIFPHINGPIVIYVVIICQYA